MPFPAPNATDIQGVFLYANTVTDGWFWVVMLGVVFIIAFIVLLARSTVKKSFASTSFLTTFIAMMMSIAGLVDNTVVLTSIILAFIGLILMMFDINI